jgi:integrase
MATVKFRLKNRQSKSSTIYVYISLGRGQYAERKTGFEIDPKHWSDKTNYPIQNNVAHKNLHADLKGLESYLFQEMNDSSAKGEIINAAWLDGKIKSCFNRVQYKPDNLLKTHIQYIIDNASTRKVIGKNALGLSANRIKSYITFRNIIEQYEEVIGHPIALTEINTTFTTDFTTWLLNKQKFSMNYAGKQIKNLKTVCIDAEKMGKEIHTQSRNIQGFSESDNDRYIVTLSEEEIKQIYQTPMPNASLENAKQWIVLGCALGQRGNDLMNIKTTNIRELDGHKVIDVFQEKTKKGVTVPIVGEYAQEIVTTELPHPISLQKLNDYIKQVCKIAGLDELMEGYLIKMDEKKVKRKVFGHCPKWQLITSHSFRRSFATNHYKHISTPTIMAVTGHTRESTFLKYINQQTDKDDNARLFLNQLTGNSKSI